MPTYTPPAGDEVLLNFVGGGYIPAPGDTVAIDFAGGAAPPSGTQYIVHFGSNFGLYGIPLIANKELHCVGFDASAFGTAVLQNFARTLQLSGIAPPPGTGANEFRQVPSPTIDYYTRYLSLDVPLHRGIAEPAFPTNHYVAFYYQFIDQAGRGADTMVFGPTTVDFTERTIYPISAINAAFGSTTIAHNRTVPIVGWQDSAFGTPQLDINLQRLNLNDAHGGIADGGPSAHVARNQREILRPTGWKSELINYPVVRNFKQIVAVGPYGNNSFAETWPPYSPYVANKIRVIGPSGWLSSRFSLIGTLIQNNARGVQASGWESLRYGPDSFIGYYTRYVAPAGFDSFYSSRFHNASNTARLVSPTGWKDSKFGVPNPVLNLNRTILHHSGPAGGPYGTAYVDFGVRRVYPRVFNDVAFPLPEVRLNPYPIKPAGIPVPANTAATVYEHFNILRPTSTNVHPVPWVGQPFVRNRNRALLVFPSDQALYGRPNVQNYTRYLTGVTVGSTALYGDSYTSYRTKTLAPSPISIPSWTPLHRIRNDSPDPPGHQIIAVGTINRNADDTYGIIPKPSFNYQSVFPSGFNGLEISAPRVHGNGVFPTSFGINDPFGTPSFIAARYILAQSLPYIAPPLPGDPIPLSTGDSESFWTKNINQGYEWPRLSPHVIYAPLGSGAPAKYVENNPPYPEPEYHAIDGQMAEGFGRSRNPFFGEVFISLRNRTIGPVPDHSSPNTDKLSPSSKVSAGAVADLRVRRIFAEGIRSQRFGRVVLYGAEQRIYLDRDHNGIQPFDTPPYVPPGQPIPPPNPLQKVEHAPEFNRTLPIPGTDFFVAGQHVVELLNRTITGAGGIDHTPLLFGTALVGYPRAYVLGGVDATLWGDAWVTHYTRFVFAEGVDSNTLDKYSILDFDARMRVKAAVVIVRPAPFGGAAFGTTIIGQSTRGLIERGFDSHRSGFHLVRAVLTVTASGWESTVFGDIDRWEAGKIKAHGDELSSLGTPKMTGVLYAAGVSTSVIGIPSTYRSIGVLGIPAIGFAGPSVTDPYGCSSRVISPLPVLSVQNVPQPMVA